MPYVTLSVRARPNCPGSSGDLAPPALCPGRKVAGQCGRIGEVHRFYDLAVRHRFSQIVWQCDGFVRGAGELLFGKALLSLRREQNIDVFVRELRVRRSFRNGDGRQNAYCTLLWEADGRGNSLRGGWAYDIDRPRSDRDVTSFEQRNQLVSLRVVGHYVWMQLFQGGEACIRAFH